MKKAKPFVKWVGGKTQLLHQLEAFYPEHIKQGKIKKYVEPFIGGGAVFFDVIQKYNIEKAYISDVNKDLILAYKVIQNNVEELISCLEEYNNNFYSAPFFKKGTLDNSLNLRKNIFTEYKNEFNLQRNIINYEKYSDEWIKRVALLIFINKTCYNGLYRLNSKGIFNAPYGSYIKPKILDINNLRTISKLLINTEIMSGNYDIYYNEIDENTFVYLDPPYRPISKTANFTTYAGYVFKHQEQLELANFFYKLDKEKNAKIMMSNSDPKNHDLDDHFFEKTYSQYNINRVSANRKINCNSRKRGHITELVITNYSVSDNIDIVTNNTFESIIII